MECTSTRLTVRCIGSSWHHDVKWKSFRVIKDDGQRSTTNCDLASDSKATEEQSTLRSEVIADWRPCRAWHTTNTITDEAINVNSWLIIVRRAYVHCKLVMLRWAVIWLASTQAFLWQYYTENVECIFSRWKWVRWCVIVIDLMCHWNNFFYRQRLCNMFVAAPIQ